MPRDPFADVVINGRIVKVLRDKPMSFERIVVLAGSRMKRQATPWGKGAVLTVTYHAFGDSERHALKPGQEVEIRPGMVFDAVITGET